MCCWNCNNTSLHTQKKKNKKTKKNTNISNKQKKRYLAQVYTMAGDSIYQKANLAFLGVMMVIIAVIWKSMFTETDYWKIRAELKYGNRIFLTGMLHFDTHTYTHTNTHKKQNEYKKLACDFALLFFCV